MKTRRAVSPSGLKRLEDQRKPTKEKKVSREKSKEELSVSQAKATPHTGAA
jgi:hypothetical protein